MSLIRFLLVASLFSVTVNASAGFMDWFQDRPDPKELFKKAIDAEKGCINREAIRPYIQELEEIRDKVVEASEELENAEKMAVTEEEFEIGTKVEAAVVITESLVELPGLWLVLQYFGKEIGPEVKERSARFKMDTIGQKFVGRTMLTWEVFNEKINHAMNSDMQKHLSAGSTPGKAFMKAYFKQALLMGYIVEPMKARGSWAAHMFYPTVVIGLITGIAGAYYYFKMAGDGEVIKISHEKAQEWKTKLIDAERDLAIAELTKELASPNSKLFCN